MKFYGEEQFNEQNSQNYNNGYYQPPQQNYDNNNYQNYQPKQQSYDNNNYQNYQPQQQSYDNNYYRNYQPQQQSYDNNNYRNYQPQQQSYDNNYYQNTQQYNNTDYQQPMSDNGYQSPDFTNMPYDRKQFLAQERAKIKQTSEKSMLIRILAIFAWFIVSVFSITIIVPKTGETGWAIVLFGQLFAVMGILVFSMQKNKIQSASLLILPIIGIFMVICGLSEIFGNNQSMGSLMGILPYIIMGAFVLAGIAIAVVTTIDNKKRKKCCTVPMQAVVIDLIPARRRRYGNGMHGKRAYTPVYEYYYYGVMYRKRDKYATNINIPQIGEQVTAFINPDNPEDAYFEYKNKSITTLLIAAAFIAIPAIILFTMLFNR